MAFHQPANTGGRLPFGRVFSRLSFMFNPSGADFSVDRIRLTIVSRGKSMTSYTTIDHYISEQAESVRPMLEAIRQTIRKTAPQAEETISYGMPAFKQNGILIYFAAAKKHIGLYPTMSPMAVFAEDLKPYVTTKGSIHLPLDQAIPHDLISRIVQLRLKETQAKSPQ